MPHVDLPQAEFKVVLLGDTFTGKTSLVLRFAEGYYRESGRSPTVGAFFITKRLTVMGGLTCKVQIWDTAGQEQFQRLAPMYYQNAAAAIVCYDVTSRKSLETLKFWLEELHKNVPAGRIVIAMAACKSDLLRQESSSSLQQEAQELATHMGAIYVATSAKNNTNVTELFAKVAERVLTFQRTNNHSPQQPSIPVTLGGAAANAYHSPKSASSPKFGPSAPFLYPNHTAATAQASPFSSPTRRTTTTSATTTTTTTRSSSPSSSSGANHHNAYGLSNNITTPQQQQRNSTFTTPNKGQRHDVSSSTDQQDYHLSNSFVSSTTPLADRDSSIDQLPEQQPKSKNIGTGSTSKVAPNNHNNTNKQTSSASMVAGLTMNPICGDHTDIIQCSMSDGPGKCIIL